MGFTCNPVTIYLSISGQIDVAGLKQYLLQNGYPLEVMLSEDGTRVMQQVQYDSRSNTITGCVAPLDKTGLPTQAYFNASNANEVVEKLEKCALASTAYVQLATPLVPNAAPYVLFYMATDNKFNYIHVIKRWAHTIKTLQANGIAVLGIASDGATPLLSAMINVTKFTPESSLGELFAIAFDQLVICFQDSLHILNNIRRRLFKLPGTLALGHKHPSISHLEHLVKYFHKNMHGLTSADLNPTDLMSFNPTQKIMNETTINFMEANVPGSEGTVALLRYMRAMYRAFMDKSITPLERISMCWYGCF